MTMQGTQVTITVPDNAPPGTLLSVPVRNGSEAIKVRVPDGVGAGSTLILTQAEGAEEWSLQVGSVVPAPESPSQANAGEAQFATNGSDLAGVPYQPVEPQPGASLEGAIAYTVRLETTVGPIDIIVRPDWAPHGTRRFLELAAAGDLSDLAFYRAIKGCIVQFGLPAKRTWPPIPDDPPTGVPFLLGAVSFAAIGENTRRSTLFICIGDMSHMLGQKSWETPIGAVAESSLDVLELIETQYGDIAEFGGRGPDTNRINTEGNTYLRSQFPMLSYIHSARPLDWQPDGQSITPSLLPPAPGAAQPATQVGHAAAALQAAHEAQAQAQQASQAAAQAAQAEHAAQAAQAAQLAREAAVAAQVAAEAAQAAQASLEAERARLEAAARGGVGGMSQSASAPYPVGSDLATAHAVPVGSQLNPYTGQVEGSPVDVPIEIRNPRPRSSLAPTGSDHLPKQSPLGVAPGQPAASFALPAHAVAAGPPGGAAMPLTMQVPGVRPGMSPHRQAIPQQGLSLTVAASPNPLHHMVGRPHMVAPLGSVGTPGFRPPMVVSVQGQSPMTGRR